MFSCSCAILRSWLDGVLRMAMLRFQVNYRVPRAAEETRLLMVT